MKKIFIILGSIIVGLIVTMMALGLWLIESHKKHLNTLKTAKGRETRIKNLKDLDQNGKQEHPGSGTEQESGSESEEDSPQREDVEGTSKDN